MGQYYAVHTQQHCTASSSAMLAPLSCLYLPWWFFLSFCLIFFIEASGFSHVASCHKEDYFRKTKFHSVWLQKKRNSCTSVLQNTCGWEQQDKNKTIKDKWEEGKKKGINVERSTVGTEKSRQPKRRKSLNLVQSRYSRSQQSVKKSPWWFTASHACNQSLYILRQVNAQ